VDDSVTATATPPPPDLLPQSEPRKGGWPRVLKAIPVALVVGVLLLFGWTVLVPSRGGTLVREIADGKDAAVPSTIEDATVLDRIRPALTRQG